MIYSQGNYHKYFLIGTYIQSKYKLMLMGGCGLQSEKIGQVLTDKMEKKLYHTVGKVPKSNRKISL